MNIKRIFSHSSLPSKKEIIKAVESFSPQRKIVFLCLACICFVSGIALLSNITLKPFQNEIAVPGGSYTEGIIGNPRFVNPVLSISNADKDIENLVFAGLTRKTHDGSIVLDLAEDFSVSPDNLTYIFTIKENARFHNGKSVTADDVVFTIKQIQNPEIKSPRRVSWESVQVEKVDSKTVRFVLSQPFIGFLENTSVGILPLHIWEEVAVAEFSFSPLNIDPIGAGKYKVKNIKKTRGGLVQSYTLKRFRLYASEKPFIEKIHTIFFEQEKDAIKAFKSGDINSLSGISPESLSELPKNTKIYTATLNRMFGIFFNQKNTILADKRIREAINTGLNRDEIIQGALFGFGKSITSPLPATIQTGNPQAKNVSHTIEKSQSLLDQAGWSMGPDGIRSKGDTKLTLKIATAKIPELERAAHSIEEQLEQLGFDIIVESFEIQNLNQNIIRPRNFEILLFGQILNQESDLFAFWHSSQISDPGLNISNYQNKSVDKSLEEALRTFDIQKRLTLYANFEKEFFNDLPVSMLYNPELLYIVRGTIHNIQLSPITNSSQRLLDMADWYTQTDYTF